MKQAIDTFIEECAKYAKVTKGEIRSIEILNEAVIIQLNNFEHITFPQ